MTNLALNPRYANYARAHGHDAAGQLAADRIEWPGGIMAGFIIWNRARLQDFGKVQPQAFMIGGELVDHDAYDEWLTRWVDQQMPEK